MPLILSSFMVIVVCGVGCDGGGGSGGSDGAVFVSVLLLLFFNIYVFLNENSTCSEQRAC
jgi:hypothetical protein